MVTPVSSPPLSQLPSTAGTSSAQLRNFAQLVTSTASDASMIVSLSGGVSTTDVYTPQSVMSTLVQAQSNTDGTQASSVATASTGNAGTTDQTNLSSTDLAATLNANPALSGFYVQQTADMQIMKAFSGYV